MQKKYQELKEAFERVITMICRQCPDTSRQEIEKYLLSMTFRIWSCNIYYAPAYKEAIQVLLGTVYTMEQIMTAMSCCGEKTRALKIPDFLQTITKEDAKKEILNEIGDYLAAAAMINGDFTMEEARCWRELMGQLVGKCLGENYLAFEFRPETQITAINEEGYYKSAKEKQHKTMDSGNRRPEEVNKNATFENLSHGLDNEKPEEKGESGEGSLADSLLNLMNTISTLNVISGENNLGQTMTNPMEHAKVSSPDEKTLEVLLEELNSLVGLEKVKSDVRSLMNFIKVANMRKKKGLKVPTISYHLVFTGNPGTGKTTIARLVAQIYYKMGLLTKGQMVETDRSALVAGYLGQTAIKTQKVIQEALGGVLFIDEAYSLASDEDDSYGKEAIETLLKAMEDHRDDLVVIVAGYDELMHKFIDSNPGLRSRFNKFFHFPDYTGEELVKIFECFCENNGYAIDKNVRMMLFEQFSKIYESREKHFGNARAVRNAFETAICCQADRIAEFSEISDEELINLTMEDIQLALEEEF